MKDILWPERGVNRGVYLTLGLILTALKYNIDRIITYHLTGEQFYPFHYWMPGDVFNVFSSDPESGRVLLPLLLTAIPFAAIGVLLTLHRLRSVGFPPWLFILFFVPFVNILLFMLLAILPARDPGAAPPKEGRL